MTARSPARFAMPLRWRMFVLVALALFPLATLSASGVWVFARQQRAEVERTATESMRSVRAALDVQLWRMIAAAETLAASDLLDNNRLADFHAAARRVVQARPAWRNVDLLDLHARKALDTELSPGEILSEVSDRESFRRVVDGRQPVVGALVPSTVPGEHLIMVRVPVIRAGQLRYVLTLSAQPSNLLPVIQRPDAPLGSVVSVLDAHGQRVVATVGALPLLDAVDDLLRRELRDDRAEGFGRSAAGGADGFYAAFGRSTDTSFQIGLALPASSVERAMRQSYVLLSIGLVLSLLLGGVSAAVIARGIGRPLTSLRATAIEIGKGREPRFAVESDIPEVREVAEALMRASKATQREQSARDELLRREQAARVAAERDNRAKDEFLAMLGHELRTPLAAITNANQLLDKQQQSSATERPRQVVRRQVAHLVRLVDERVFDLFAQGPQSLHRSGGGLGIGLTLVKKLTELHGGSVVARSAGKGRKRVRRHPPHLQRPHRRSCRRANRAGEHGTPKGARRGGQRRRSGNARRADHGAGSRRNLCN